MQEDLLEFGQTSRRASLHDALRNDQIPARDDRLHRIRQNLDKLQQTGRDEGAQLLSPSHRQIGHRHDALVRQRISIVPHVVYAVLVVRAHAAMEEADSKFAEYQSEI